MNWGGNNPLHLHLVIREGLELKNKKTMQFPASHYFWIMMNNVKILSCTSYNIINSIFADPSYRSLVKINLKKKSIEFCGRQWNSSCRDSKVSSKFTLPKLYSTVHGFIFCDWFACLTTSTRVRWRTIFSLGVWEFKCKSIIWITRRTYNPFSLWIKDNLQECVGWYIFQWELSTE